MKRIFIDRERCAGCRNCQVAVVLGGGLVGIETAEALAGRGLPVTVIEIAGHILPMQLNRKAAARYEHLLVVEEDGCNYKKLVLKEGRIVGAILQGDISGAGVVGALTGNKINLTDLGKSVFELTYADFFCQGGDGSFRYVSG